MLLERVLLQEANTDQIHFSLTLLEFRSLIYSLSEPKLSAFELVSLITFADLDYKTKIKIFFTTVFHDPQTVPLKSTLTLNKNSKPLF